MRTILAAATAVAVAAALLALAAPGPAVARPLGSLIAPASVCPGQGESGAPVGVQLKAMRCMTNYARERSGLAPLGDARPLDRAAAAKSADILRCDEFSHEACGREFTYWMERFGYMRGGCWGAGENIAWATGGMATVRGIFAGWVHSPGHLANILGDYTDLGIGFRVGAIEGVHAAHVWTQDFGASC
jgi:uncharacterized protein YkwD